MNAKTLLFALLQTGATVSLAALVPMLLRRVLKKRYPARAMCVVWTVLALRLLVPVQLTLPEPPVQIAPRTQYVLQQTLPLPAVQPTQAPSRWVTDEQAAALGNADAASATTLDVTKVLAALWLVGALGFVLWQLLAYHAFRARLRRQQQPVQSQALCELFEQQACALGVPNVVLRISGAADGPLLLGFLRSTLYLPDEALSAQDAAFILRHELTHARRGDLWRKLLLTFARAVQWFNPLVHLFVRFAYEDIELACDAAVAQGLDSAQKRAYGETILRAAVTRARRRALVSCWGGDKKTLLRRLEGLFDKNAQKRGAALVLAVALLMLTLGCAVSVGRQNAPTDAEKTALADAWARQMFYDRYAVKLDGVDTYVVWEPVELSGARSRTAQKLAFERKNGAWAIAAAEAVDNRIETAEQFRIFYENDLGIPDVLGGQGAAWGDLSAWNDPADAVKLAFGLADSAGVNVLKAYDVSGDGEADITPCEITFVQDDSTIRVTLMSQFGAGWLPQDWTDANGQNARTTADLAQQVARAVSHKSAQFLYPVLSRELTEKLVQYQQSISGTEAWYWKLGGSSPSFRGYRLEQTENPNERIVVLDAYGGGAIAYLVAYTVRTSAVGGRTEVTAIEPYDLNMQVNAEVRLRAQAEEWAKQVQLSISSHQGVPAYAVIPQVEDGSATIVYARWARSDGALIQHRVAERVWFADEWAERPSEIKALGSTDSKGMTFGTFLLCYQNELGLPVYDGEAVTLFQRAETIDLSTPENGARLYGLDEGYGAFGQTESTGDTAMVTYRFWDAAHPEDKTPSGEWVELHMRRMQTDGTRPGVWLAEGFAAYNAAGEVLALTAHPGRALAAFAA